MIDHALAYYLARISPNTVGRKIEHPCVWVEASKDPRYLLDLRNTTTVGTQHISAFQILAYSGHQKLAPIELSALAKSGSPTQLPAAALASTHTSYYHLLSINKSHQTSRQRIIQWYHI